MTLSQVLMEMRELSMEAEKYSSPCLQNTKFEILTNNQRISQVGNYIYSSGIQEWGPWESAYSGVNYSYVVFKTTCPMGSPKDTVYGKEKNIVLTKHWGTFVLVKEIGGIHKRDWEVATRKKKTKAEWSPPSLVKKYFHERMISRVRCCCRVMWDEDSLMTIGFSDIDNSRREKWRQSTANYFISLFVLVLL